jgi:hypothetical protein
MKKKKTVTETLARSGHKRIEHVAEGGASGALVGALVGSIAGPPGAIAGALIGGVTGGLAGAVVDQEASATQQRTSELDKDIGVIGGDIGAPNLKHLPPTVGAYSAASSGAGATGVGAPAEGPIQNPES